MSTFSATLNAGTSNASKLVYGGATNTLVVTESSPPSDPFSSSTTVSLSYSTPGVTYNFSSVSKYLPTNDVGLTHDRRALPH